MAHSVDIHPSPLPSSEADLLKAGGSALRSLSQLQGEDTWTRAQVLEFRDVGYRVEAGRGAKRTEKTLLSGVSGEVRSGEIVAVMGPSGAGKSTFLDAVAGRIKEDSLDGAVLLNGERPGSHLRRISAYCQQDDELFAMLTVEETLMFAAGVRLPPTVSYADKKLRVKELIQQLGLEKVAKSIVGDAGRRGVSGGERRRVSIGIDIIHDPAILFLDEPTSGLDAASAFSVVEHLHRISRAGSLVMCTIHQPSFRILDLFDKLLVFSAGKVAYFGSPEALPARLQEAGIVVPLHANSAEVIMDKLYEPGENGTNAVAERLIELQVASTKTAAIGSRDKLKEHDESGASLEKSEMRGSKFANNFFMELWWLVWRANLNILRTPPLFIVRIVNVIMTSILLASLFWRPNKGVQGVNNIVSFIVFAICLVYFTSNDALAQFIQERFIFIRESSHYSYRTSSYVVANMVVMLPFLLLLAIIFTLLCWWTVGLSGGVGAFFFFVLVLFCAFFTANSFVSFLSALVPDPVIGNTVALAVTAYFLLTGGFFIKRSEIPGYWLWFHYLSSLKWPYDALLLSQFPKDKCYSTEPLSGSLRFSSSSPPGGPSPCTLTGADVLSSLAVGQVNRWACCAALIALGLTYRFLFYVRLYYYSKNQRK